MKMIKTSNVKGNGINPFVCHALCKKLLTEWLMASDSGCCSDVGVLGKFET